MKFMYMNCSLKLMFMILPVVVVVVVVVFGATQVVAKRSEQGLTLTLTSAMPV